MERKTGFTLPEALIILVIIGVVIAITIPLLIYDIRKTELTVGVKQTYSTLKKLVKASEEENDSIKGWDWQGTGDDFDKYFLNYLHIIRDCKDKPDVCMLPKYDDINGAPYITFPTNGRYFVLANGKSFAYIPNPSGGASFFVDINGKKGPNRLGRDLFEFVTTSFGVKPACFSDLYNDAEMECISKGECCAVKVLADGEMAY